MEASAIELVLTEQEAGDLASVLDAAIADLSPEIADTDNPRYRAMLREQRDRLRGIRQRLGTPSA
jgi:hypothetical protein